MWAQSWGNIAKHVLPYPDAPAVDATPGMIAKVYSIQMYNTVTLGLIN
jgi:hypothetical protein